MARRAGSHIAAAAARDPGNADVMYYAAVVHARADRVAEAMAALEAAFRNGYSPRRAQRDPDLATLRAQAAYRKLIPAELGGDD